MSTDRKRRSIAVSVASRAAAASLGVLGAVLLGAATFGPSVHASSVPVDPKPVDVEQVAESPKEGGPSALRAATLNGPTTGLPEPTVALGELRSGGPPPDGIPPLDRPSFIRAAAVDFLAENEPVMALEIDGEARAYPVQILIWHEIVNDTVGGVPVAVTYCPLCNSAIAYDRRVGTRVVSFGTSGMLWNSALVMYDRQTESLWSHFTGEAIAGVLTGTELETFAVATVSWGAWRAANPDGLVLSRNTGFDRAYGRNPYPGYDDLFGRPFLFEGEVDGRFTAMTRVVGVQHQAQAAAVPLVVLRDRRVVPIRVGGADLVVWWQQGTTSALDEQRIVDGDDIGATGVFIPVAGSRRLTFSAGPGGFVDAETGSTWSLLGRATAGPLAGAQLQRVAHVDTFWFAWAAFRPDTEVMGTAAAT